VVPESNMPAYPWLARTQVDTSMLASHLAAQQALGVPYSDEMIAGAARDTLGQATPDSDNAYAMVERYGDDTQISAFDGVTTSVTELDALIAYLQVLGQLTDAAYQNTAAPELPADPPAAGAAIDEE